MKFVRVLVVGAVMLLSSAAAADKAPCPPREPGHYPWGTNDLLPGDEWAWVYLDVDKTGSPLRCYIGQSNVTGEESRSDICRSFVANWQAIPPANPGPHGVTRISRYFVIIGTKHQEQFDQLKRQYFRDHPDQLPECFEP